MIGERAPLACWFRRRAETNFLIPRLGFDRPGTREVRDAEDVIASTRDARAPQNSADRQKQPRTTPCAIPFPVLLRSTPAATAMRLY
jgi:hypothetical protein